MFSTKNTYYLCIPNYINNPEEKQRNSAKTQLNSTKIS